ncbi:toll/interleukin-1 receptor domain-containing protein [Lysinibacillus fusiformis]|uniref:toll/interleukin-1 receptor domain-containing protein n=1 Tax=Lysinibacillus fusiformis TaxID=28031 RepID=UPI003D0755E9
MSKIFISHSTKDGDLAIKLMDLLQNQFNLSRPNFFLTSDEELKYGGDWIEEIREGMEDANIILPLITPNYLESQFCLCELGAAWINQIALVPVIIPPLDYNALKDTPYRSWVQAITLNSVKDIQRLAQAMIDKSVGTVQMVRFTTRAENFYSEVLQPFVNKMESRDIITPKAVGDLKAQMLEYQNAYQETEDELNKAKKEIAALRKMKNVDEIKEFDYAQMNEWELFLDEVDKVKQTFKKLKKHVISILYHHRKVHSFGGFIGEQEDLSTLKMLENEGYITFDSGWVPDFDHLAIQKADKALDNLAKLIETLELDEQFCNRFMEEYEDVRLSLDYSPFWENVLDQRILHSSN